MATVTGYTAARMKAIEDSTVVDGEIAPNGHLMLETRDGTQIDAGGVQAPYAIQVQDTPGIDLTLTGAGIPGNPWSLKATIVPVEVTAFANLDTMVSPGMWMVSDPSIGNTLRNWPVEAIPRTDNADAYNAAGSYRAAPTGTLTVNANSTGRIEQTVCLFLSIGSAGNDYPPALTPFTFKRIRSGDGVTWGGWILQNQTVSVATYADREFLSKLVLLGLKARSPVRCLFAFGPVGSTNGGWSSPFEALSVDGVQWWDPLTRNRGGSTGWAALPLQNGITDYSPAIGAGWPSSSAIRTSGGIILVRGLATKSTVIPNGTVIATLPPGMRPSAKMMFAGPSTSNVSACQIVVNMDGTIVYGGSNTGSSGFVDLSCIIFPAADVAPNTAWTPVNLNAGWIQFTGDSLFGVPSYWKDKFGRVWFRGMVQGSPTGTADSNMFSVPLALAPVLQVHNATPSSQAVGAATCHFLGAGGVTQFVFKSGQAAMTNGWVSLSQFFLHPTIDIPETLWRTILLANGWIRYPSLTFPTQGIWTAPDGISHLRGLIQGGNTPPTAVSVAMGANDRPNLNVMYLAASNAALARYSINGGIADYTITANSGGTPWFSLDGGHYMTEV